MTVLEFKDSELVRKLREISPQLPRVRAYAKQLDISIEMRTDNTRNTFLIGGPMPDIPYEHTVHCKEKIIEENARKVIYEVPMGARMKAADIDEQVIAAIYKRCEPKKILLGRLFDDGLIDLSFEY